MPALSCLSPSLVDLRRGCRQNPRVALSLVGGVAFDRAVAPHEAWLLALARRLTRSPADAQDLVQDTLEKALLAWGRFEEGSNLRAWLSVILNNLFLDQCRRTQAAPKQVELEQVVHQLPQGAPEPQPDWLNLGEGEIRAALPQVQEDFRAVFALHLEGLSYQEISERLGLPRATVGTRLLRARKELRALLSRTLPSSGGTQ
jgi:RNA polymerase sigma-70 factor, ECF subfamily